MGNKRVNGFWLMKNLAVGGTGATFNSVAQNVTNFDNISIEVDWTIATISGLINVQASVSQSFNDAGAVHTWSFLDFANDPNNSGAHPGGSGETGNFSFALTGFPFPYIRFQYVDDAENSAAGNINVFIYSKDVN